MSKGLVGLQNLGNTCYMNGALQALSNCQQLTRFVLDCPGFLRDQGLVRSYSELIREIWNSEDSQYAVPTSIIRDIKCIYPAFRGCTQQDTQEFLRCFLEQLHDELKQPVGKKVQLKKDKPSDSTSENESDVDCNNISKNDPVNNATTSTATTTTTTTINSTTTNSNIPSDANHQRSIISDTFEFKISSSVVCSNCNNISTTKETFKDLSIPIPSRDHPYYRLYTNSRLNSTTSNRTKTSSMSLSSGKSDHGDSTTSLTSTKNDSKQLANAKSSSDNIQKDSDESSGEDSCKDFQTKSYLDSIPLARWLWEWLNKLGYWFWGPQVTLQDCLSIFFGTDPLEGDNEYSCEVCTKKNRGVKYLKILELPEVLCIHFKRYESTCSAKITTHVSFPITGLDLAPYMSEDSRPQCTTYNLIACICHHGSALSTGHYTTYALNCYDDQWYEFDDQYVTNVQQSQVENSEAYILFYQKSTLDDATDKQRVKASKLLKKSLGQEYTERYYISKQWINKFNTFVEPGPITNSDFLCAHEKVPRSREEIVEDLCYSISEPVWSYLSKLHGGGPECHELILCNICE